MKILQTSSVSSFGGLNFVLREFNSLNINALFKEYLPDLPTQSKYSWKDIFYSLWSIFFCGGDCAEDASSNLRNVFHQNPFVNLPSPDCILSRLKMLAEPQQIFNTPRGTSLHKFSFNECMNNLNLALVKKMSSLNQKENILDYDNTILFTRKADAANTYMKATGYCPGVGIIGNQIVYLENRNGNSDAQTLQQDTLQRMFDTLRKHKIKANVFRADSASFQLSTLLVIIKNVDKFYIRARMNESVQEAMNGITTWEKVEFADRVMYRGETVFTPFQKIAKRTKQEHLLKECRLIVTKEARRDGQLNLFTGEAYNYYPLITDDFEKSATQVVCFYNQRGAIEREFDILKNDFGWNKMPFSKLEQNTVFLLLTAICRNIYHYIISKFSKIYKGLSSHYRIKKFIFRFICLPAKWVTTSRQRKLRIYGSIAFKT